ALIRAAKAAGVKHFIYHSVIHGQVEALTHHRDKRVVEGMLMESLIDYTILQPTMYMQSTTREWAAIKQTGEFRLPQSTDIKMSVVDLDDIGIAAANVTVDPGWVGGCFEICNGEQLTRAEMATMMGEALGRPVLAVREDIEAWQKHVIEAGHFTPAQVRRVRTMQEHYAKYGLAGGNGKVLELLIGRKPTTYREYVARIAKA
ncbi:MAG: NmrA family NAD(P)-binding protein, partial [Burkholderiales bacterium]